MMSFFMRYARVRNFERESSHKKNIYLQGLMRINIYISPVIAEALGEIDVLRYESSKYYLNN